MNFSKTYTVLYFYANQDQLAAQFCVNKDKPKLHCNGKCYLCKQLAEQEKKEAESYILQNWKIEFVFKDLDCSSIKDPVFTNIPKVLNPNTNESIPFNVSGELFKPPCLS